MFRRLIRPVGKYKRSFSSIYRQNPFSRTIDALNTDMSDLLQKETPKTYPEHTDVVIIGGGVIGASIAYWIKTRAGAGLSVVVIEKDLSYKKSCKDLCIGVLNQHYSLPENIYSSLYSADFFRNIKEHLKNNEVDIDYRPIGHLMLASEEYAETLETNLQYQKEIGVKNELLSPTMIKNRYPWINVDDIKLGSISTESEGFINSWKLHKHLVQKSMEMGTTYVEGEVVGFRLEQQRDMLMEGVAPGTYQKACHLAFKTPDNETRELKFAACIVSAGGETKKLTQYLGIGLGDGMLSMELPIELREQKVYSLRAKNLPQVLDWPLVVDTSGLRVARKNFNNHLTCYHVPLESQPPESEYYEQVICPSLKNRIPSLKDDIEIISTETEWHDHNIFDDTGVIGPHPYHNNLYIAAGFGMQGYQHAPGIGRAVAELLIDNHYTTIDFTRFGFDRFLTGDPLIETNFY